MNRLQRGDRALPDDRALAEEADLGAAGDGAVVHVAAGDWPDPGHREDLADLGLAGDDLFELGREQADHGVLDVLEDLVDDLVGADLDVLGCSASSRALRSGRTLKPMIVALDAAASWMSFSVMPPTPRWTNDSFTSSRSSLREALGERLERAGDVGLER